MTMYTTLTILTMVACALLGGMVLIQNPKGGGLTPAFNSSGQQILGARRSTQIVERLTWGLAFAVISLCLFSAFFV